MKLPLLLLFLTSPLFQAVYAARSLQVNLELVSSFVTEGTVPNATWLESAQTVLLIYNTSGGVVEASASDGVAFERLGQVSSDLNSILDGLELQPCNVIAREFEAGSRRYFMKGLPGPGQTQRYIYAADRIQGSLSLINDSNPVYTGGTLDGGVVELIDMLPTNDGRLRMFYVVPDEGNGNTHVAISNDDGLSWLFENDNPFGDKDASPIATQVNVDPAPYRLQDGTYIAATVRAGVVYFWSSTDGLNFEPIAETLLNATFVQSLVPGATTLSDPSIVQVPGGDVLMYVTASNLTQTESQIVAVKLNISEAQTQEEGSVDSKPVTQIAVLDGSSVVPASTSNALGLAAVSYNPVTGRFTYNLYHSVQGATSAAIRGPADTSTNGNLVFDLGTPNPTLSGSFTLDQTQADQMLNGQWYFNITSETFPEGEIRGQIIIRNQFSAALTAEQVVGGSDSQATGVGIFILDPAAMTLNYVVTVAASDITGIHIHGPAAIGETADILFDLGVGLISEGTLDLSQQQISDLNNGLWYVNVHTESHPTGAIRGQVTGFSFFVSLMTGLQQVPPVNSDAAGIGIYLYDNARNSLNAFVLHSVENPTAAHIHGPASSIQNADVLHAFSSPNSPFSDILTYTEDQETDLFQARHYINIHSNDHPNGEIRGHLQGTAQVNELLEQYGDQLAAWGSDAISACFGETVTVDDLIAFLDNGLACPE